MSFFDQPYYALNKAHMSRIGIWPEQSKSVRIIRPLATFATILSFVGPQLVQLHNMWGDIDAVITLIPQLLIVIINFTTVLNSMLKANKMKVMLEKMETHWKMFKNTSAVIVLNKYAERGRYLTTVYTICVYIMLGLFFAASILPAILEFVDPLNETRRKDHFYDADYGVDADQYYWFLLAHGYIVTIVSLSMILAIDTMYVFWVEHACALFEVVGFNLKLATDKYMANKKNADTIRNDCNYQKICECINVHKEAISFAGMIESLYSGSFVVVMGTTTIIMSLTAVKAVIHMGHPDVLIQLASFTSGQVFHFYFNSIPGQNMIDHSLKIHTFAYDLDWYDLPVEAQKLLILILMQSRKPCRLTAGKIYVLSMESFGSVMQTSISYFMIFAQLV